MSQSQSIIPAADVEQRNADQRNAYQHNMDWVNMPVYQYEQLPCDGPGHDGLFDPAMVFQSTAGWAHQFEPWSDAGGYMSAMDRCIEVDYPRAGMAPLYRDLATSLPLDQPPNWSLLTPDNNYLPQQQAMANNLPDDYEAQRRLAETYQPDLSGPNISSLLDLQDLVDQYAEGHPAYKEKTLRLVQDYSFMRRVKGDRKCGWRAVYYVYCEILLELGSADLIMAEKRRVQDMYPDISTLGECYMGLWEDMSQEMYDLYDNLVSWIGAPDGLDKLRAFFNALDALHVLYGLRLITSLGVKNRQGYFSQFLETSVDEYCTSTLLLPEEEIDETGLRALNDVFLAPAGIKLEVLNLHDNPGHQVDVTQYPASAIPARGGVYVEGNDATVRLLFTPGHYDIIYASAPKVSPVRAYTPLAEPSASEEQRLAAELEETRRVILEGFAPEGIDHSRIQTGMPFPYFGMNVDTTPTISDAERPAADARVQEGVQQIIADIRAAAPPRAPPALVEVPTTVAPRAKRRATAKHNVRFSL